jgi:hypothetical protein
MLTVDFPGTNIDLIKPEQMTDEECSAARAFVGIDDAGYPFILTAWKPNKEDLDALNAGRPLMLKIIGQQTPPVAMYTYNENYEANI